jgi:hypothetical protein
VSFDASADAGERCEIKNLRDKHAVSDDNGAALDQSIDEDAKKGGEIPRPFRDFVEESVA